MDENTFLASFFGLEVADQDNMAAPPVSSNTLGSHPRRYMANDEEEHWVDEDANHSHSDNITQMQHIVCLLCNQTILPHEHGTSIWGNAKTSAYVTHNTRTYPPRQPLWPGCPRCDVDEVFNNADEAECVEEVKTHQHCFQLFLRHLEQTPAPNLRSTKDNKMVLDHLFTALAWRLPWKGTPLLNLDDIGLFPPEFVSAAGIPGLASLPAEILQDIWDLIHGSPFHRYCSVLCLARRVSSTPSTSLEELPLNQVAAWERGTDPHLCLDPSLAPPIVRLTIDSHGIRKLKRLAGPLTYDGTRSDRFAFAIIDPKDQKNVSVQLKHSLCRLVWNKSARKPRILWDTPWPPVPTADYLRSQKRGFPIYHDSNLVDHWPTGTYVLQTVPWSQITGLTLFGFREKLVAMHAHTNASPSAQRTFQRLSAYMRKNVVWRYYPISSANSLKCLTFATLQLPKEGSVFSPFVSLQTALYSDTHPEAQKDFQYIEYGTHDVPTAAFCWGTDIAEADYITTIGAYPERSLLPRLLECDPHNVHFTTMDPDIDRLVGAQRVVLPLVGVVGVRVYKHGDDNMGASKTASGKCVGLVFDYADGNQRAMGRCRIGIDDFVEYRNPERICGRKDKGWLEIECCDGERHHDWECMKFEGKMRGTLRGLDFQVAIAPLKRWTRHWYTTVW